MFKPVGSLIKVSPVHSKSGGAITAMRVRQVALDLIKKEIGGFCDIKTIKPSTFRNGVLTIIAPTLINSELHMRSEGLKRDINKTVGGILKDIRFKSF